MRAKSRENLKMIRFAGELLPDWAQLLDMAARMVPASLEARDWFSRMTNASGVEDSRTVLAYCELLRDLIEHHRESVLLALAQDHADAQPSQILKAWFYALDTMIQVARSTKTCSWIVEGTGTKGLDGADGGEISLRRV